jgi:hypothetical protein
LFYYHGLTNAVLQAAMILQADWRPANSEEARNASTLQTTLKQKRL